MLFIALLISFPITADPPYANCYKAERGQQRLEPAGSLRCLVLYNWFIQTEDQVLQAGYEKYLDKVKRDRMGGVDKSFLDQTCHRVVNNELVFKHSIERWRYLEDELEDNARVLKMKVNDRRRYIGKLESRIEDLRKKYKVAKTPIEKPSQTITKIKSQFGIRPQDFLSYNIINLFSLNQAELKNYVLMGTPEQISAAKRLLKIEFETRFEQFLIANQAKVEQLKKLSRLMERHEKEQSKKGLRLLEPLEEDHLVIPPRICSLLPCCTKKINQITYDTYRNGKTRPFPLGPPSGGTK